MFAQASILGNVGQSPQIKVIGEQNTRVASMSIAVNEKRQGNEITHWFNITAFGKTAEFCERWVARGSKILVTGTLKTRQYEKEGVKITAVDLVADKIELVSSPQAQQGPATGSTPAASTTAQPQAAAPAHGAAYRPGQDDPLPTDDDNDLPF